MKVQGLAVDDRIYVRTTNDVRSYDKAGTMGPDIIVGTPYQSSASRLALAVDADAVYYANVNAAEPLAVIRRPKGAASQPTIIGKTATAPTAIVLDGSFVYWTTSGGEIWRAGKNAKAQ